MKRVLVFIALTVIVAFVFYFFVFSDSQKDSTGTGRDYAVKSPQGVSKDAPDIKQKAEDLHRETYQKRVDESLKDFESRLERLKADTRKAGKKTWAKLEDALGDLDGMLDDAKRKLAEMKNSTGQAWDNMKNKMDASLEALEKKYKDVVSKKG
ncbi:MAG TPA: hypothetical protein PLR20_12295 [Syntrophales bacterium]|nr:hypothetical protein [Syntrophales bacterium]HOX93718.1 hypothetical protein [Syntrophales bacterium]HPI57063.1 hypothetical protein [Syntrophales bacterium]HPN23807.1 hypothetical protein [Syntrophales bacterium]HQM30122.1 hypothetical protein [Syntrophales bacterium]